METDLIVVAVALTDDDAVAVDTARTLLSKRQHGRVLLLHVLDQRLLDSVSRLAPALLSNLETELHERSRRSLDVLARQFDCGVTCETRICSGDPAEQIIRVADDLAAGLVIVGAARRPWRRALLGSTARHLATGLDRPLWIVQGTARARAERALIAVEPAHRLGNMFEVVSTLLPDGRGELLHVVDRPGSLADLYGLDAPELQAATVDAAHLLELLPAMFRGARWQLKVEHGHPVGVLLRQIEHDPPDVLVMGSTGLFPSRPRWLGSVAAAITEVAACDVLLIPLRPPTDV